MAVTAAGHRQVLDFQDASLQEAAPLLSGLFARGPCEDRGLLCIIDGAKGLRKAVADVFGQYAQVQQCTSAQTGKRGRPH